MLLQVVVPICNIVSVHSGAQRPRVLEEDYDDCVEVPVTPIVREPIPMIDLT